jgi:TolB-like protein
VLPFDYLGADESKNYLADGVLDAITSHLAGIPELRVIARSSVEKYRQSTADARDIGRDLKVGYLLEGSFQLEGEQVRLMARLVDPAGGTTLWSKTYDREWRDIFAVQSEVALAIAEAIKITVSPEAKASMQARSTPDLTAYEYYLKGRHYITYDFQEEHHTYAIQMYEKALERDPNFAPAWLGLMEVYRSQYWLFMDRSDELVARIKTCLAKAKALEPDSKEYRWHEALYLHSIEREYPRVIRLLEQMLDDYPNDDLLLSFMGFVLGPWAFMTSAPNTSRPPSPSIRPTGTTGIPSAFFTRPCENTMKPCGATDGSSTIILHSQAPTSELSVFTGVPGATTRPKPSSNSTKITSADLWGSAEAKGLGGDL